MSEAEKKIVPGQLPIQSCQQVWRPALDAASPDPAAYCGGVSHTGVMMDARDAAARASPAADPGLLKPSMSSPEEELAAVLHRAGCENVSFSAINKMFQRQVLPTTRSICRALDDGCGRLTLRRVRAQARRLDTQRVQQEQNRQAIEKAMEHMQTDLELQKLQSARQVGCTPSALAVSVDATTHGPSPRTHRV